MDERLPIERLRLPDPPTEVCSSKVPSTHKRSQRFLKGPIPWPWLVRAISLPGKAAAIAVALWHWSGLRRSRMVRVAHKDLRELGVGPQATGRGLRLLERAGLVHVDRRPGQSPVVTILDMLEPSTGKGGHV